MKTLPLFDAPSPDAAERPVIRHIQAAETPADVSPRVLTSDEHMRAAVELSALLAERQKRRRHLALRGAAPCSGTGKPRTGTRKSGESKAGVNNTEVNNTESLKVRTVELDSECETDPTTLIPSGVPDGLPSGNDLLFPELEVSESMQNDSRSSRTIGVAICEHLLASLKQTPARRRPDAHIETGA